MIYTLKVQSVYDEWSKAEREIFQEHNRIIWICVVCQYMEVRGLNCDVLYKRYLRNPVCLNKQKCVTQLPLYFCPTAVDSRCSQRYAHSGTAFTFWSKVLEYALEMESKLEFMWVWNFKSFVTTCAASAAPNTTSATTTAAHWTLSIVCFK